MPENAPPDEGKDGIMDHWFRIPDVAGLWTFATTVGRYRGKPIRTNLQLLYRFAHRVLEVYVHEHNSTQETNRGTRFVTRLEHRRIRDILNEGIHRLWYELATHPADEAETLANFCKKLVGVDSANLGRNSGEYIAFVLAEANIKHEPAPKEG